MIFQTEELLSHSAKWLLFDWNQNEKKNHFFLRVCLPLHNNSVVLYEH